MARSVGWECLRNHRLEAMVLNQLKVAKCPSATVEVTHGTQVTISNNARLFMSIVHWYGGNSREIRMCNEILWEPGHSTQLHSIVEPIVQLMCGTFHCTRIHNNIGACILGTHSRGSLASWHDTHTHARPPIEPALESSNGNGASSICKYTSARSKLGHLPNTNLSAFDTVSLALFFLLSFATFVYTNTRRCSASAADSAIMARDCFACVFTTHILFECTNSEPSYASMQAQKGKKKKKCITEMRWHLFGR